MGYLKSKKEISSRLVDSLTWISGTSINAFRVEECVGKEINRANSACTREREEMRKVLGRAGNVVVKDMCGRTSFIV